MFCATSVTGAREMSAELIISWTRAGSPGCWQWTRPLTAHEDVVVSHHPHLRDDLGAIVLDTNAMGDGSLTMKTMRGLPRITTKFAALGIWIAEP